MDDEAPCSDLCRGESDSPTVFLWVWLGFFVAIVFKEDIFLVLDAVDSEFLTIGGKEFGIYINDLGVVRIGVIA